MSSCMALPPSIDRTCSDFLYRTTEVIGGSIKEVLNGRGGPRSYLITGMAIVAAAAAVMAAVSFLIFAFDAMAAGLGKTLAFAFRVKSVEGQAATQLIGSAVLTGLVIGAVRGILNF